MLKDCPKESEKDYYIQIWAVMLGLESKRQHHEHKCLSHLECGRWLQGCSGIRELKSKIG